MPFPILVVEDDTVVTDILIQAAKSEFPEARLIPIHECQQAIDYLEGLQGMGPRLVLLDLALQEECSGFDFLKVLKQHPKGRLIPVVILSQYQTLDGVEVAYNLGANAYTVKPFSFEGWKDYARQLRAFWYVSATVPRLQFEPEDSANE